ncbi:hypothetical protein CIHG_02120 [Coccidioides immitis H538.4]|uniref:Uncharacterized protein n=1 Tax=Coccidioides immitis H538.4 TaxID=396776 RepID=A0A0J8RK75_COCIT|nr:hypothetical protein CIHG_02120 [Coccidioides immitis H538.4]
MTKRNESSRGRGAPIIQSGFFSEPLLDDIRHMEEMEKDVLQREAEEKEKPERDKANQGGILKTQRLNGKRTEQPFKI